MRNRIIIILAVSGILAGLITAYILGAHKPAQPPEFQPVASPYETAIYANGMIESEQSSGDNINLYPEVSGTVTKVLVHEGQAVKVGMPLLQLDDSVPKANTRQLQTQAEAANSLLEELKAQPRRENLAVAEAQVEQAQSNLVTVRDQYEKRLASWQLDARSISRDALDTAKNARDQAEASLRLAQKQYELVRAGAWSYEIKSQENLYQAARQAALAAEALLGKYTIRSQIDGVVLAVNAARGGYVSPQGAYDGYTQASVPVVVMSSEQAYLSVRCFVDEILVTRLPRPDQIRAEMSIRGTSQKVALEFVRVQPLVSPKLELSNQRQEKVDLRVLPVLFRFAKKDLTSVFPGQQVDVYIGKK